MTEWAVLLKDKVPAYITWEQYERNQRQLQSNSTLSGIGVPRSGLSLLVGLLICGHCGLRMATTYAKNSRTFRYSCSRMTSDYAEALCQSLKGNPLDDLIVGQCLEALEPAALEVSLKVAEDLEKERNQLVGHWKKQLERAHYDTERAYRQYNVIEPENRLVARTLEKKWEETLSSEEKLKKEYDQFLLEQPTTLSSEERNSIRQLASDIPSLWEASTTTQEERKEIIRLLIERILVTVEGKTEKVRVEIHWSGGHKTHTHLIRPISKLENLSYFDDLMKRAQELKKEGNTCKEIAVTLNQERWCLPKRKSVFDEGTVGSLLSKGSEKDENKKTRSSQASRLPNEWTLQEVSHKTNIPRETLYAWMKKEGIRSRRAQDVSHKGVWLITADEEEFNRLRSLKNSSKLWVHRGRVKRVE